MRILLALLLSVPALAFSQDPESTSAIPPPPCSGPPFRQFDFWIGDWNVTSDDQPAGTNSIRPVHNDCALEENWQGAGSGGVSGSSLNIYDKATGRWHQTWVDGNGTLLQLDGSLIDGAMVLSGERPAPDGNGTTTHRISWTPHEDGSVRQVWEASRDGQTWSVLFDGHYTRAAGDE